jgi:DnaJ-class molecular chaperone
MAARNYYVVLGVASNESPQGVREAFHELVRRHHPDRAGPSGVAAFREIMEAYSTLSDPQRRDRYDASLERTTVAERIAPRELSLERDLVESRPSHSAMFERFARNFTSRGVPKGEGLEDLDVDVAISEAEAARGTSLRIGVPVFGRCAACAGSGCAFCEGRGVVQRERAVALDIPPMLGRGTSLVVPLSGLGIHNFYLRVRVRIDRELKPIQETSFSRSRNQKSSSE